MQGNGLNRSHNSAHSGCCMQTNQDVDGKQSVACSTLTLLVGGRLKIKDQYFIKRMYTPHT